MQVESPVFLVLLFHFSNQQTAFSGWNSRSIAPKKFLASSTYYIYWLVATEHQIPWAQCPPICLYFRSSLQKTSRELPGIHSFTSFYNMSISLFLFHLVPPTLVGVAVYIPPYHCFLIFPSSSIFLSPPSFCFSHPYCNLSWLFEGKKHKAFFMHQSVLIG